MNGLKWELAAIWWLIQSIDAIFNQKMNVLPANSSRWFDRYMNQWSNGWYHVDILWHYNTTTWTYQNADTKLRKVSFFEISNLLPFGLPLGPSLGSPRVFFRSKFGLLSGLFGPPLNPFGHLVTVLSQECSRIFFVWLRLCHPLTVKNVSGRFCYQLNVLGTFRCQLANMKSFVCIVRRRNNSLRLTYRLDTLSITCLLSWFIIQKASQ